MKNRYASLVIYTLFAFFLSLPCPVTGNANNTSSIVFEEFVGPLKIGMPAKEVKKVLKQKPEYDGPRTERQTDGNFEQTWLYPQLGITIGMGSEHENSEQGIESIIIVSPCTFIAKRGVRIGSEEKEVLRVYKKDINNAESTKGKLIVVGGGHESLFFKIMNGSVSKVAIRIAVD